MPRILLDQNVPAAVRRLLRDEVFSAAELGWGKYANGALLDAAEAAGFDILITADQNMRYQQNLTRRGIAIIVLQTNHWRVIREQGSILLSAVANAKPGTYQEMIRAVTARPKF